MGWVLAVDFGTTNTGAAIRYDDGRVEKVKLEPMSDTMPSAVVLTEGGWRVGRSALNVRRSHPDTFVGSPKARLGQEPTLLGGHLVTPAQVASLVLGAVRQRAVRAAGGTEPEWLVLTHPVRWGCSRLDALAEAARLAGFAPGRVRLLPEPVAALHAHLAPGSLSPGSRVVVVDVGGGTCDVAVLQATDDPRPGGDLLVVAQEGDDRLGGNDLDTLLYQWVLDQLDACGRHEMVALLGRPENLGASLTLLDVVREAKQDLSEHADAPVAVAVAGLEATVTVTRDEYEALVAEPMSRAADLVARALRASATTELAGLYLTGGTAYTPALARALHRVTGILASPLGDPKLVTATGALHTPAAVPAPARPHEPATDQTTPPAPTRTDRPDTDQAREGLSLQPGPVVGTDHERPSATKTTTKVLTAVLGSVLVLGLAGAGVWWAIGSTPPEQSAADKPTSDQPSTDTARPPGQSDDQTPDLPDADITRTWTLTGTAGARAAFPRAPGAPKLVCMEHPYHDAYLRPEGALETFQCTWTGSTTSVFITRWDDSDTAISAWRDWDPALVDSEWVVDADPGDFSVDREDVWRVDGVDRGSRFSSDTSLSPNSSVEAVAVYCYADLPYCMQMFMGVAETTIDDELSQFRFLSSSEAAALWESQ